MGPHNLFIFVALIVSHFNKFVSFNNNKKTSEKVLYADRWMESEREREKTSKVFSYQILIKSYYQ